MKDGADLDEVRMRKEGLKINFVVVRAIECLRE